MSASAPLRGTERDDRALARIFDHYEISCVIDVGANIGQYASRLRRLGWRGRIVSIEPVAAAHAALERAADGDPAWTVAPQLALGAIDGTVTLNVSAESDMSSVRGFRPEMAQLLDSARFVDAETVPLARLDGWIDRWAGPTDRLLLKLDTQGYDFEVLAGAAATLARVWLIQVELALAPVYQGEPDWRAAADRLAALGFQPILLIPGYFNRRTARLLSADGVFARVA